LTEFASFGMNVEHKSIECKIGRRGAVATI